MREDKLCPSSPFPAQTSHTGHAIKATDTADMLAHAIEALRRAMAQNQPIRGRRRVCLRRDGRTVFKEQFYAVGEPL
jgi:hypothetical protein